MHNADIFKRMPYKRLCNWIVLNQPPLPLGYRSQVDAQEHQALAGTFGVTGYPTLKWMPKGKTAPADAEAVNAGRNAEALSAFVSGKTGIKPKVADKVRWIFLF